MLDQFGDQLGNLYTGATVLEDIEGLRVDIPTNQALAGSGTYIDPVGFFNHNGIHVPADSPQIATWEADPNPALPIPNDPTQTQNIGVKVDTFVLSPAIVNRQVTPAPPAISYGDVALINLKQRGSAMRPVKNVVIGLLLIVVVGLLAPIAAGSQSAPNGKTKGEAQDRDSDEIPGGVFLQELGEKNNCYFTLEEIWRDGHVEDLLGSVWVKRGDKNRPLADVLQSMQRKRPNFGFEPDPKNPQIIHIIDLRLGKLRNYSLDQVLDRFDFSGTTPELISSLAKQGVTIQESAGTPPVFVNDPTRISISANRTSVREILGESLPPASYNHFMWKAITRVSPDQTTFIAFHPLLKKQ